MQRPWFYITYKCERSCMAFPRQASRGCHLPGLGHPGSRCAQPPCCGILPSVVAAFRGRPLPLRVLDVIRQPAGEKCRGHTDRCVTRDGAGVGASTATAPAVENRAARGGRCQGHSLIRADAPDTIRAAVDSRWTAEYRAKPRTGLDNRHDETRTSCRATGFIRVR